MKLLRFEGYSDDTFGEYNTFSEDDDDCASCSIRVYEVVSKEGVLRVCGQYANKDTPGCWMIGVQADDNYPVPAWPIRIEKGENPYSPALIVEAPDDAELRLWKK